MGVKPKWFARRHFDLGHLRIIGRFPKTIGGCAAFHPIKPRDIVERDRVKKKKKESRDTYFPCTTKADTVVTVRRPNPIAEGRTDEG